MLTFDSSISLGNILVAAGFLVSVTLFISGIRSMGKLLAFRLSVVDLAMQELKEETKKLADVITKQALQDQRITMQDDRLLHEGKRVDELERRVNKVSEALNNRTRDEWDMLRAGVWLDGATWKQVPADIIHWGESAPGGQPVLASLPPAAMFLRLAQS